ncbi:MULTISPECIES: WD40/YVTN/BNR-like repeat-containing protein [unclassified Thiocapsa]|uniref:WD40/YVTN/BNR-like repeat-containing protein n=1 Tax=unclassified Thiocapsa TaxID=2641286 RepID=UPI0035B23767
MMIVIVKRHRFVERTGAFADPLHGWAAGNDSDLDGFDDRMSVIWATRDGGATWEEQYREPTGGIGAVVFANSAVGYAFGRTGLGLKTTDGGQTWQPLSMPAELAEDEIDTERLSRISRPDSTEVEPASSWLEAGATNNACRATGRPRPERPSRRRRP